MMFGVAVEGFLRGLACHRGGDRGYLAPQAHADANARVRDDVAVPLRSFAEARDDDVLIGRGVIDDLEHRVSPRPTLASDVLAQQHAAPEEEAETEPVEPDRCPNQPPVLQYSTEKLATSAHTCRRSRRGRSHS